MKKSLALTILCIGLVGCRHDQTNISDASASLFNNPYFVERFSDDIVLSMVNLKIYEDPILEDEQIAELVEETRKEWLEKANEAEKQQRAGRRGQFIAMKEFARGYVVYLNDQLHFDTTFEATPGPNLHVFLTTTVDPRDVEFPDETAIDLGLLQVPYGAQSYSVPPVDDPVLYRTVVLWDSSLNRLYGFAQISS